MTLKFGKENNNVSRVMQPQALMGKRMRVVSDAQSRFKPTPGSTQNKYIEIPQKGMVPNKYVRETHTYYPLRLHQVIMKTSPMNSIQNLIGFKTNPIK